MEKRAGGGLEGKGCCYYLYAIKTGNWAKEIGEIKGSKRYPKKGYEGV